MKLYFALVALFLVVLTESAIYAPLIQQKHGPLYEGIRLLIVDERFKAELVWNETRYHINETTFLLEATIDHLNEVNATINKHLDELKKVEQPAVFRQCLKQYEREIAHFNRDLYTKYRTCKKTLVVALDHFKNQTVNEISFIENSSQDIQRVTDICNIQALKSLKNTNHAGVLLCVTSYIGQIDQRLFDSSQFCLDVISDPIHH